MGRRCGRDARGKRSDATGKFSVRARAATELAVAGSMGKTYSRAVSESEPGVIVVADDDVDILELVALTLERVGHVVHRARDGEEALELVKREHPDLAVLDVSMPKLDGFELTRSLRLDPDTSTVRIVLLTARVQDAVSGWRRARGTPRGARPPPGARTPSCESRSARRSCRSGSTRCSLSP